MGKLNIAHHKSYHPYRRDNIEKVRRDEEEAELKEAREEGRISLADSEARITLLRERAGASNSSKSRRREDEKREKELLAQATDADARREALSAGPSSSSLGTGTGKHINLFEDLEQTAMVASLTKTRALEKVGKGKAAEEAEKGIPLAPSQKDLRPWYSEKEIKNSVDDVGEKERDRDKRHKSRSDPLTNIQKELAARYPSPSSQGRTWGGPAPSAYSNPSHPSSSQLNKNGSGSGSGADAARTARVSRETSERARAQALIERKRREAIGSATPSTVRSEDVAFRYGDQFHAREVEEAHRRRERDLRQVGWGGERVERDGWDGGSRSRRRER